MATLFDVKVALYEYEAAHHHPPQDFAEAGLDLRDRGYAVFMGNETVAPPHVDPIVLPEAAKAALRDPKTRAIAVAVDVGSNPDVWSLDVDDQISHVVEGEIPTRRRKR